MVKKSITNPDVFKFIEEKNNQEFYGSNQRWYSTFWQRLAGCGPCAASNIFYYQSYLINSPNEKYQSRRDWVTLMEELWEYVKPSIKGVNRMEMLYDPLVEFAQTKGINLSYHLCEVPEVIYRRPTLDRVIDFLSEALEKDAPIAFLNWCNGEVKNLDGWHWVTIIQLDFDKESGRAYAGILDEGRLKTIDLALWLRTTIRGGGFVYFEFC